MSINIKATVFLVCMLLFGCVSTSKTAMPDPTGVSGVLAGVGEYSVPEAADYNVDLTLRNDVIDNQLMTAPELPKVIFTVWGFDELAADVSATELKVSEFELRPQSVPYYLRFNASKLQLIEFQSGSNENLKYYVTLGVDMDGDGKFCNGDYRQDYSLARPERFKITQTDIAREIPVSEISGEICPE